MRFNLYEAQWKQVLDDIHSPMLGSHDNHLKHHAQCLDVPVFTGISKSASLRSCRESPYSHHDDWIINLLEPATTLHTQTRFLPDGQYLAPMSSLVVQRSLTVITLVSQFVATTTNRFRNFN
jgi:hypothetical protein